MRASTFMAFLREHKAQAALSVFAMAATVLAGVGLMTHSGYLISRAALRPPILDLMVIIVGVRFFALSRAGFRYLERLVSHDLTFRWLLRLRVATYQRLRPLMPGLLLTQRSGDVLGSWVADVETLQNQYLRVFAPVAAAVIVVCMTVIALFFFSPWLALTALFFLLLNGVAVPWFMVQRTRGCGRAQITERAALQTELVETLQGCHDLLLFGRETDALQRVAARDHALAKLQKRQADWTGLQDALSHYCAHFGMAAVLLVAIPLVTAGAIQGVWLALLALGVLTSFEAVQQLGTAFQFHEQTCVARERVDAWPEPNPEPVREPGGVSRHDLRFDRVDFAYHTDPVLQGVSFTVHEGKRIGLIGPSGAGKSTVAHLLLGFAAPTRGRITCGGADLRDGSPADLRRSIAVVPQQTHLFNASIRDNLQLAQPNATDAQLREALDAVQLAGWVDALPDGLGTFIGEQGARLSGGERQRLAIARALLKDAPIWILDEPTTHLDARTERVVIEQLLKHTQGRTVLWITHRLLQMDALDHLLVMAEGRVVERGTHARLMEDNAYYARMIRQQNQLL